MRKLLLTMIVLVFALALSAQTGLFDLAFGDTSDTCDETLTYNGFEYSHETEEKVIYVPTDNAYVDSIELVFNADDELTSWSVCYLPQEDENIEEMVIDALVSRHGEDYDWDDEWEYYTWYLDDGHTIEAGWDLQYDLFWVDYYSN